MYFVIVDDCKVVIHFVIGFASLPIDKSTGTDVALHLWEWGGT